MKNEYAVALLTMMGYRMAQESSEYHLLFRTYAGWIKKSAYLLIMRLMRWQETNYEHIYIWHDVNKKQQQSNQYIVLVHDIWND